MTDTPTKKDTQSKTDNIPGDNPGEQKKNNRNNDRKRNRRGDSKNLERDSDWQERVVQIRRVSKTVKGGKKMSFRAIVVVGNEKGQVGVGVGKAGDVIGVREKSKSLEAISDSLAGNSVQKYPWLEWNKSDMTGNMVNVPLREDIPENIKEQLIVELYSK